MKHTYAIGVLLLLLVAWVPVAKAQLELRNAFPALTFEKPVELLHAGDGTNRLFVVSQNGRIYVFPNTPTVAASEVFLDISNLVTSGGERGLLGLAFHPDFRNNGYFYVNYTRGGKTLETVISRFSVVPFEPNQADPASEQILLTIKQPYGNHNGGKIAFGPDGYLYVSTGDGGSSGDPHNNAQNLRSLLGKILRIDVNVNLGDLPYAIPADNPFRNNMRGYREEIYAYGLRNVWKFSFDWPSGQLWAADVGQNSREEVNVILRGGNYGWRIQEGTECFNPQQNCHVEGLIPPLWEYTHDSGLGRSITGGVLYSGSIPSLRGKYIYGDFVSGNVWALSRDVNGAVVNQLLLSTGAGISAFGEDTNRELYICSYQDGRILRLGDAAVVPLARLTPEPARVMVEAFPNPASKFVTIDFYLPNPANVHLRISNALGTRVDTLINNQMLGAGPQRIMYDVYPLQPGEYMYLLKTDAEVRSGRIQVQK